MLFFKYLTPLCTKCTKECLEVRYLSKLATAVKISAKQNDGNAKLISCKRKQFDCYLGSSENVIELASKGWANRKSIGDYFTIYPNTKTNKITNIGTETSFKSLGVNENIIKILSEININFPTEIQSKAIPTLLTGKNSIIGAETGSGKTLAYLIPTIQHLLNTQHQTTDRELNSPLAVILLPNRELAYQVGEILNYFVQELQMNSEVIVGGRTKKMMINPDFNNVDVLVATLGAISKLTTTGIFRMNNCHHLIMDEADTLLDDSFNDKLKYFLKHFKLQYGGYNSTMNQGTQLMLVNATLPTNVEEALGHLLPADSIKEIKLDRMHAVMEHVPQKFIRIGRTEKSSQLLKLVKEYDKKHEAVIIFSNKTETCNFISLFLNSNNIKCINLNGEMPADIRQGLFRQFQDGFYNIISCTDIASRGLDTTRVKYIINFDFPLYTADYIHRVGRTGRIGSPENCSVVNFITGPREVEVVQIIELAVRQNQKIPNVNGNITRTITNKILKSIRKDISNVNNL